MQNIIEFLAKKHQINDNNKFIIYSLEFPNYPLIKYDNSILYEIEPSIDKLIDKLNDILKSKDDGKLNGYILDLEDLLNLITNKSHYIVYGTLIKYLKNKSYFKNDMIDDSDDIKLYMKVKNSEDKIQELYIFIK